MIRTTPEQIKYELYRSIHDETRSFGVDYRDFTRNRKLTAGTVAWALMAFRGGSLRKELYDLGIKASPSAFVQQRDKFRVQTFRNILFDFNEKAKDLATYRGFRLLAVDGTGLNIPYSADSKYKMTNGANDRGYCQIHLNLLYDLKNNLYLDCREGMDEIGALLQMLYTNMMPKPCILILDRGYESYNTVAHLLNIPGLFFVLRARQDKSAMREIAKLPMVELDWQLSMSISTRKTKEDIEANRIWIYTGNKNGTASPKAKPTRWDFPSPYDLSFRVVRVQLNTGGYETLITNLPSNFTCDDLRELYAMRWGVETSFRNLKYAIGMINIHAKKEKSIFQEIYVALCMFNFTNRISRASVVESNPNSKYAYKVDFKMAVHLSREFFRTPNADGDALLRDIAQYTVPVRLGRQDKRNLKAKTFAGFPFFFLHLFNCYYSTKKGCSGPCRCPGTVCTSFSKNWCIRAKLFFYSS